MSRERVVSPPPDARGGLGARRRLEPYEVADSGRGLQDCLAEVNLANFQCYGPDYRYGARTGKVVVDTLDRYEALIRALAAMPRIEFVPHAELIGRGCPPDRILCSIRHDIDADIRAAASQAEIEHRYGARTSHYVLHTAPYYGRFVDGVFRRNGCMSILYRRLQDLGQEVAVHTDPLWVYQHWGIDGAEALRTEIEWLRAEGLEITGTVAHNSASVYGIENFAVFKGRNRRGLALDAEGPADELLEEIVHEGKWAPLGMLDEAALGLTYEGNDVFRQPGVPFEYGATRRLNRWRWNAHMRRRRETNDPAEDAFIDQDRMLAEIAAMAPGRWLILVVHPLYYGSRHCETSAPPADLDRVSLALNDRFGWETYAPNAVQAQRGEHEGRREFQVINYSDADGMLDAPSPEPSEPSEVCARDAVRFMILGGRNVDGRATGVPEHVSQQAARLLAARDGRPVWFRQLAFPGMGLCRHFAWFRACADEVRPTVVVIGLGADEIVTSAPRFWSVTSGFNAAHPPGAYLWPGDDGAVRVVPRSPGAAIRRRDPRPLPDPPSLTRPADPQKHRAEIDAIGACLRFYADAVRAAGATPIAMLTECGESVGLWAPGADPASRRDGHRACLSVVRAWTDGAGLDLVDPYALFLEQPGHLPAHWAGTAEWNYTGQRLATTALVRALPAPSSDAKIRA